MPPLDMETYEQEARRHVRLAAECRRDAAAALAEDLGFRHAALLVAARQHDEAADRLRERGPVVTRVDFAVPTGATVGARFPEWGTAVVHARGLIDTFRYIGQKVNPGVPGFHPRRFRQDGDTLVVNSREFVQMREVEPVQDREVGPRSGRDSVVRTWEVFYDGTTELRP